MLTRTIPTLIVVAFAATLAAQESSSARLDRFFTSFTDEWMRYDTDLGADTRYLAGAELDDASRRLRPETAEWRLDRAKLAERGLRELRSLDRTSWTEAQLVSADVMENRLEVVVKAEEFADFDFPLVQSYGRPTRILQRMTVGHAIATPRDAENYVARLSFVSRRVDEALREAQRLIGRRMIPPRFIVEASLREMRGFITPDARENVLVSTFATKMKQVSGLEVGTQQKLRDEAERIVRSEIYPAWNRAIAVLDPLMGQASNDPGLWRLPRGGDAYAFLLRASTTTDMTADQIHETGLKLEAEIDREMDRVLRELGHTEGTVRQRYDAFLTKQPTFPATEQGAADYRADIDNTIADGWKRTGALFDKLPKAPVVAEPYPTFFGSRAASYLAPSSDGSRPGTFQFTLQAGARKFSRSSIYHETVPGHHMQLALEMENGSLPRWRQVGAFGFTSASTEGWALYAEQLVAETGWYEGDLAGLLSQLQRKQFRARRLVADTGLHAKRWTRQQAVDYLGPALETADAASEVDRYVVTPAQACSYMIGALRILELRERAKRELGAGFSLKAFHDVILDAGTVPLDVLDRVVDRWIQRSRPV